MDYPHEFATPRWSVWIVESPSEMPRLPPIRDRLDCTEVSPWPASMGGNSMGKKSPEFGPMQSSDSEPLASTMPTRAHLVELYPEAQWRKYAGGHPSSAGTHSLDSLVNAPNASHPTSSLGSLSSYSRPVIARGCWTLPVVNVGAYALFPLSTQSPHWPL